ncbi:MAG: methylated-DNA--[protein]-cysteine S-methyltransferase [Planctomycetota bacterium]|jgi:methylated-DNA-[protein]-cysteine S-methyltransferase
MTEYRARSSLGDFLAAFENGKLTALRLPGTWRRAKKPPILKAQEGRAGRVLLGELGRYLSGKRVKFTVPIAPRGTEFQRRVWKAMRRVPWGRTVSYGQLAKTAGSPRATRAAGSACGANRIVIVNPCHRITAAKGLGGFGSGLAWKRRLLRLEGHDL